MFSVDICLKPRLRSFILLLLLLNIIACRQGMHDIEHLYNIEHLLINNTLILIRSCNKPRLWCSYRYLKKILSPKIRFELFKNKPIFSRLTLSDCSQHRSWATPLRLLTTPQLPTSQTFTVVAAAASPLSSPVGHSITAASEPQQP